MRFPEKNSRGETILKAFLKGPMTIYQATEVHGEFATRSVPDGIDHEKMVELYIILVDRGCLVRKGILYDLSIRAGDQLRKNMEAPAPRSIVPAAVRNFFSRPLFIGYSPRSPRIIAL